MIPLSLYAHIPWCEKKCPYCDFNSHLPRAEVDEAAYVKALISDLDQDLQLYRGLIHDRPLQSIFIGGGTPSLFSATHIASLLEQIGRRIEFAENIEITLEANPGSSEAERFKGFRQAGVNRLSIGVQSFNSEHLAALGRVHGAQEALDAARYAERAGFNSYNLDLMFGLPRQSVAQAVDDLKQAIELQPKHLSCYQLTIEPNTLFHHQPPVTPDDEILWEMQSELQALLGNSAYSQYEVSAYSLKEWQCQHNRNYWEFGDYLAIGAGAHGKVSGDGRITRFWKVKHPTGYLQRSTAGLELAGARTVIQTEQLPFEFMLNTLRLSQGFDLQMFSERTFLPLATIQPQLDKHQQLELIHIENDFLQPTPRGKNLIDSMLQDYLANAQTS